MKENCDQPSRMGCIDCIKFTHKEHNADLIDYKDVNKYLFIFRYSIKMRTKCRLTHSPMTRYPKNINYSQMIMDSH